MVVVVVVVVGRRSRGRMSCSGGTMWWTWAFVRFDR